MGQNNVLNKKNLTLFLCAGICLAACESATRTYPPAPPPKWVTAQAGTASNTFSNQPKATPLNASTPIQIQTGSGQFFNPDFTKHANDDGGGDNIEEPQDFIFRNAPLDAVLNQVLGETYGLSYSVNPSVSATLTLRLENIETATDAIAGLNAALALQNLALSNVAGTWVLSNSRSDSRQGGSAVFIDQDVDVPADASTAVVQMRFAKLDDLQALAEPILPANLIKSVDEARGLVVIAGDPSDVSAGVSVLRSLDVNWLGAVSTAFVPISNAAPSDVQSELEPLLEQTGGVTLVPIDRLQKLLIVARSDETLQQISSWAIRLNAEAGPQLSDDLLIYEARHVSAEDLVALTGTGAASNQYLRETFLEPPNTSDEFGGVSDRVQATPRQFGQNNGLGLYSELSIQIDLGQNAVIARGPASELRSLNELLSALDKPKRQVLIEATIIEVTLTDSSSLGVQWDLIEDRLSAAFIDSDSGVVSSLFPGVSVSYIDSDISAVINALATTRDVEIVSSPRMLVLNNETARLQIGDQVPIITQSAVSVTDPGAPLVNSTSYRDTGVILTVTPRVRAGGMVEVEVSQEVSNVAETTTSNIDSPTISQRSLESVLAMPSGATAVLGGLMSSTRTFNETGVPYLRNVPVLGGAFRSQSNVERRTELIILIAPTVVPTQEPITDIPILLRNALLRARYPE